MLVEVRNPARTNKAIRWRTLRGGEWGDVGNRGGTGTFQPNDSTSDDGDRSSITSGSGSNLDGDRDGDDAKPGDWEEEGEGGTLVVVLVLHVVDGVPRDALGPTAGAREWRRDAVTRQARCPDRMSVALVKVPVSGAAGIFPRNTAVGRCRLTSG